MGDQPPGGAGTDHPADGIENLAEVMATLAGVFGQQGQVGGDEGPLVVADIGVVGLAWDRHTLNYVPATTKVRNTL